jgi:hypothetical protein
MKSKILGLGLGLAVSTLGVVAVPAAVAFADTPAPSTCYTGCTTPLTSPPTTPVPVVSAPIEPKAAPVAGGGLPFTGADISEMAAVGAGALVAGGLMVRRSRRLRQVAA